jgi:hypothetical protein
MTPAMFRLRRQLCVAAAADKPNVPEAGRLLWSWFLALHGTRIVTMAGAQAISHAEIEAFSRVEKLTIRPDHVATLRAIDDAWLAKARTSSGGSPESGKLIQSRQEMNPAVFDAMFG